MTNRIVALALVAGLLGLASGTHARDAAAEEASDKYTAAELKELVAPVALYPDVVLASMLPASTVPNDVKAAAEYIAAQGGKVESVPEDKNWDKSVQAMLQYPDVLAWLKDNATWMEQMAFAVSVQQSEVLKAIQDYRAEVQKAGNLKTDEHLTINVEDAEDGTDVIVIEPTNPEVVYVPSYDPYAVAQPGYSGWGWGWGFAAGAFTAWAFHEMNWGGSHGGSININNNWNNNIGNRPGGGNIGPNRPSQWNPSNRPGQKPGGGINRPSQRPGGVGGAGRPGGVGGPGGIGGPGRPGGVGGPGGAGRPGGVGGVKPPATRPSTRPGAAGGARPSPAPKLGGAGAGARPGGGAGSRPSAGTRPSTKPSGGFSGSGGSSSRARAQSQRGGSSLSGSRGGSSYKGHSRGGGGSRGGASRGGGGGRGGGGRGGGGRGGGGGRRR